MINLKYKIVEINKNEHSIVVRFYTDTVTEAMLSIDTIEGVIRRCRTDYSFDLPVPAPRGEALDAFILERAPVAWFETQTAILDQNTDTSIDYIDSMLNVEKTAQVQTSVQSSVAAIPTTTI